MNTKIMEGLVGATTNMRQTDTTMRVFRDARRRGDLDVMERAMEYTGDYTQKAGEYQEKAQEGMEEEAQEVREKMKAQMAEAIQNRKEEQKEQDEKLAEAKEKKQQADTLEVSQEGQALLLDNLGMPKGQTQPGTGAGLRRLWGSRQDIPYRYSGCREYPNAGCDGRYAELVVRMAWSGSFALRNLGSGGSF